MDKQRQLPMPGPGGPGGGGRNNMSRVNGEKPKHTLETLKRLTKYIGRSKYVLIALLALTLLIALVDAIPVLGTGTVLIPWSAVYLIQGQHIRAIGLLGIYVVAFLSRSILEPRLVGRQLGLDPLMTLVALYVGYRIWGFAGMLLSPLLCVAATELANIQS